jgi:hypothetical protein
MAKYILIHPSRLNLDLRLIRLSQLRRRRQQMLATELDK